MIKVVRIEFFLNPRFLRRNPDLQLSQDLDLPGLDLAHSERLVGLILGPVWLEG